MNLPEEKDDPVWKLLGHARSREASPFFSRNVAREIRKMESEAGLMDRLAAWLKGLRRPALLGGLAAALAVGALIYLLPGQNPAGKSTVAREETVPPPVFAEFDPASEVGNLEYLGQLMAVSDPAELDDAAFADLLF